MAISRTAVWKHIQTLMAKGYPIEATPHHGYRLQHGADVLDHHRLTEVLKDNTLITTCHHLTSVNSTNSLAKTFVVEGSPEGTLIVADEQTAGRGRQQRTWYSLPQKGVFLSLTLRPTFSLPTAPKITLVASVAIAKTLCRYTDARITIKWPNDILCEGAKIAGILSEVMAEGQEITAIIVGVGMNIAPMASVIDKIPYPITWLSAHTTNNIERIEIIKTFCDNFQEGYQRLVATGDCAQDRTYVIENSATLSQNVTIQTHVGTKIGKAIELLEDGALRLQYADGTQETIYSGDIMP